MIQLNYQNWWRRLRNLDKVEKLEARISFLADKENSSNIFYGQFPKTTAEDINTCINVIVDKYPEFIYYLQTRIAGAKNDLARSKSMLEDNKRFILFGRIEELKELLATFEKQLIK